MSRDLLYNYITVHLAISQLSLSCHKFGNKVARSVKSGRRVCVCVCAFVSVCGLGKEEMRMAFKWENRTAQMCVILKPC